MVNVFILFLLCPDLSPPEKQKDWSERFRSNKWLAWCTNGLLTQLEVPGLCTLSESSCPRPRCMNGYYRSLLTSYIHTFWVRHRIWICWVEASFTRQFLHKNNNNNNNNYSFWSASLRLGALTILNRNKKKNWWLFTKFLYSWSKLQNNYNDERKKECGCYLSKR